MRECDPEFPPSENNKPPHADAGPEKELTLPVDSTTLDGSKSSDDQKIASYRWEKTRYRDPRDRQRERHARDPQCPRDGNKTPVAQQFDPFLVSLHLSLLPGHTVANEARSSKTCIGGGCCAAGVLFPSLESAEDSLERSGPDPVRSVLGMQSCRVFIQSLSGAHVSVVCMQSLTHGPDGVKIENADSAVATVTGLQVGVYEFTLSVRDERNLASSDTVSVIVKEELNQPPVARISGNVQLTLPLNMAALDGSKSSDDKGVVTYQWSRDEGSPAAGEVLNQSDRQPVLLLTNLVEGTYIFNLRVSDAKGESSTARGTVEVRPDPQRSDLVEMLLAVGVSQVSERQKGMLVRQIAVLLRVLDSDIVVQEIQEYTEQR
ncbi:UNVERIFIED_CONTAM: hypothetical protein FKN15_049189 [Acipenser sinensis]